MIHLDYRDARPIYVQIMDGLREQIATGILLTGERLPSVREMAGELTINPNTIQRAYRQLEAEGWIATVPGKGCFVCGDLDVNAREQERWYHSFDEATLALLGLGVGRDTLACRVKDGPPDGGQTQGKKGGMNNA